MGTNYLKSDQIYSYLALRKAIGWIGILLPFTLMSGVFLIFKGKEILPSISDYYYTGMRDVFVGSLCAVALFLFFYKGYNKWDNRACNMTGFFALGIALFPTVEKGPINPVGMIHFICAVLFFLMLAAISLFLFTKQGLNSTKHKMIRNKIYISCALIIIVCMITLSIYYIFIRKGNLTSSFVFWAETVALVAFGISWLTKGGTFFRDK